MKNGFLPGFCMLFLCITTLVTGCVSTGQPNEPIYTSTEFTALPGDIIHEMSSSLPDWTFDDLAEVSDIVIIGQVVGIQAPKRWEDFYPEPVIYTDVIINPEKYFLGEPGVENVAIRLLGGRVGNEVCLVSGGSGFTLGEKCVLFLWHQSSYDLKPFTPVPEGINPGKYYALSGDALGKWEYKDGVATSFGRKKTGEKEIFSISEIEIKVAALRG
jgi:hypothetical protein